MSQHLRSAGNTRKTAALDHAELGFICRLMRETAGEPHRRKMKRDKKRECEGNQ